jgi:cytochrome P450
MGWLSDSLITYVQRTPRLIRALTGLPQRLNPIFRLGKSTIVLKADDVREVLNRPDCFELGPTSRDKMLMGKFLLGMDPRPLYKSDKAALIRAIDTLSSTHLEKTAVKHGKFQMDHLQNLLKDGKNHIDIVLEYVEPVVTRFSMEFFLGLDTIPDFDSRVIDAAGKKNEAGVSIAGARAASAEEYILTQWLRNIGSVVAVASPASFGLQETGEACAGEFQAWLDEYCRARLAAVRNGDRKDCVLDRLLDSFDSGSGNANDAATVERARRNIAGLMLAGTVPIIKSFIHLTDQLLQRKDPLPPELVERALDEAARESTRNSKNIADGRNEVTAEAITHIPGFREMIERAGRDPGEYPPLWVAERLAEIRGPKLNAGQIAAVNDRMEWLIVEAWRFNTTFPVLLRSCPRDEMLAAESSCPTTVPAGDTVMVSPAAAMNDREYFPQADVFRHQRPLDNYMHFGWGGHECLGKNIATVVLRELTFHLLPLRPDPKRRPRRIEYDGPAVHSYKIILQGLAGNRSQ